MDFYKTLLYCTILTFIFQYAHAYEKRGESELDSLHAAVEQTATKQQRATALLKLCPYFQRFDKINLDSISFYAHKALNITEKAKGLEKTKAEALYYLAFKAIRLKELDSARIFISDLRTLSEKYDYGIGLTYASYRSASLSREENNPDMQVYHLEEAYKVAKEYDVRKDILFDTGVDLASAYLANKYSVNDVSEVLLELEPYVDSPDISLEAKGLFYLRKGIMYYDSGDKDKALRNDKKSYDIFKEYGNKNFMYAPLQNIASNYYERGSYAKAIATYKKVMELGIEKSYPKSNLFMGHSNMKLGNYEKAEENLLTALSGFNAQEKPVLESKCLRYMAELYKKTNRPKKSKQYSNLAILKIENNMDTLIKGHINQLARAYYSQFMVYQHLEDYKNGLKYYKLYSKTKGKINDEQKLKFTERFDFLKTTLQKDNKIAVLESQNEIHRIETSKQEYIKIGLFLFSALILLLLGIVLNRFSLKKRALKIIREKNKENELLMREIHHRVKNNLQIILSLLGGQIDKLEPNQEPKSILIDSQNKIKSMAIIHQNLYSENQYAHVSVSSYIHELVDNIQRSFDKDRNGVQLDFDDVVKEDIKISLAVPLGLIINELVTNSYKYAFTKGNDGVNHIKIIFEKIKDTSKYRLVIKDNGIGLPSSFDIKNLKSYGLELVQGLVSQLNGTMEIIRREGTSYHIVLEQPAV